MSRRAPSESETFARLAASAIAEAAALTPPTFDWTEDVVGRQAHARRAPAATIRLPTGGTVVHGATKHALKSPIVTLTARDGHSKTVTDGKILIMTAWADAQATAIASILGRPYPRPEPEPAVGALRRMLRLHRRPDRPTPVQHLASAIGRQILARAPEDMKSHTHTEDESATYGWTNDRPTIKTHASKWIHVGNGVRILRSGHFSADHNVWVRHAHHMVAHQAWGVVYVPSDPILAAFERRRSNDFAASLPGTAAPPSSPILGNATAARIQSVCREALARNPDLASPDGARIDALVYDHLPRLLATHAAAAANAPASQIADMDGDLARGLEIVRSAAEQAVAASAMDARTDLLVELRFLELRHPEALNRTTT